MDGPLRSTWKTPSVSSIMMAPPPSPRAKLAIPVSALIASDDQQPAGLSAPCAQFRKDCWHLQKPSFGRWLGMRQRFFRNWTLEKEQNAGVWGRDEIRNIHGSAGDYIWGAENFTGALSASKNQGVVVTTGGGSSYPRKNIEFDAAKSVPTGPETVPQHIWQPVVLYLGRSA